MSSLLASVAQTAANVFSMFAEGRLAIVPNGCEIVCAAVYNDVYIDCRCGRAASFDPDDCILWIRLGIDSHGVGHSCYHNDRDQHFHETVQHDCRVFHRSRSIDQNLGKYGKHVGWQDFGRVHRSHQQSRNQTERSVLPVSFNCIHIPGTTTMTSHAF